MTTLKNYLIGFLLLTTLAAGGLAWTQYSTLSSLQFRQRTGAESASETEARLLAALQRQRDLEAELAALRARSEDKVGDAIADVTEGDELEGAEERPPRENRRDRGPERMAELMKNPTFVEAMNLQRRGALDNRYADLFAQLNLPPAQLNKLKDLLIERQTSMMDVMTAARDAGITDRDQIRALAESTRDEIEASIQNVLGEDGYAAYENYSQNSNQRQAVEQIEQRLSYSSTPLQSAQAQQLVSILANAESDQTTRRNTNSVAITDQVIQEASSVLTTSQLNALKELQQEQQAGQLLRETMGGDGNGPRRRGPGG